MKLNGNYPVAFLVALDIELFCQTSVIPTLGAPIAHPEAFIWADELFYPHLAGKTLIIRLRQLQKQVCR